MGGSPLFIYDTHSVRISPRLIQIDEKPAMTLLAVQRANVAGEEARQELNSDFSKLDG